MSDRPEATPAREPVVIDVLFGLIFAVSLVGVLVVLPWVSLVLAEWQEYPEVGDAAIGLRVVGPAILGASLLLLLAAVLLAVFARSMPIALRILSILPPLAGCGVGLLFVIRALGA